MSRGFPEGKKSDKITVPDGEYVKLDYFRGIVDADGSLGVTANGFPFVSLITNSAGLAECYTAFLLEQVGCCKKMQRNNRDNVFNIAIFKEDAQALATLLYYDGCLALPRKKAKVSGMIKWQRPAGQTRWHCRSWNETEDNFILTHSVAEAVLHLGRTDKSIKTRLWRLAKQ